MQLYLLIKHGDILRLEFDNYSNLEIPNQSNDSAYSRAES